MGADIHTVVQHKVGDHWETLPLPDAWRDKDRDFPWEMRSYTLFGLLAGVRDSNVDPIADPRGVPDDAGAVWAGSGARGDPVEATVDGHWLGDHSRSWVTVQELLDVDLSQPYLGYGRDCHLSDVIDLSWAHQLATLGKPDEIRLVFGFDS